MSELQRRRALSGTSDTVLKGSVGIVSFAKATGEPIFGSGRIDNFTMDLFYNASNPSRTWSSGGPYTDGRIVAYATGSSTYIGGNQIVTVVDYADSLENQVRQGLETNGSRWPDKLPSGTELYIKNFTYSMRQSSLNFTTNGTSCTALGSYYQSSYPYTYNVSYFTPIGSVGTFTVVNNTVYLPRFGTKYEKIILGETLSVKDNVDACMALRALCYTPDEGQQAQSKYIGDLYDIAYTPATYVESINGSTSIHNLSGRAAIYQKIDVNASSGQITGLNYYTQTTWNNAIYSGYGGMYGQDTYNSKGYKIVNNNTNVQNVVAVQDGPYYNQGTGGYGTELDATGTAHTDNSYSIYISNQGYWYRLRSTPS